MQNEHSSYSHAPEIEYCNTESQLLIKLGTFPSYDKDVSDETMTEYETAIESIETPISNEEAIALCKLLWPDDFYGLAWSMIHSIETAPNWPITEAIESTTDSWQETFKQRVKNSNAQP